MDIEKDLHDTNLKLTERDKSMLAGDYGAAVRMAMSILVQMAEIYRADTLLDISAAHIDSTIYIGEAGLEYAERFAELGAKVAVPTTLNVSGLDEYRWKEWAVPVDWAEKALRQMQAYASMGTIPTWTCAPYQTIYKPAFGDQIAWGESNAIAYANAVLGARTERYPDLLDICCAITGRAPAVGLHLTENRAGEILLQLSGVSERIQKEDIFYPVLGTLLGKVAPNRIPVVEGLTVQPTEDQLKAIGAAAASSGAVAMFHLVGITPEAPTVEAAFQGRQPRSQIVVTPDLLQETYYNMSAPADAKIDLVAVGCPHFSLNEFAELALVIGGALRRGERRHPDVTFLVTTSRSMLAAAEDAGYLESLRAFGAKIVTDTCVLATPMLPPNVKHLMTNSGKYAYYAPGMLGVEVTYGSLEDCVRSSITGKNERNKFAWR